jgi:DSBA-like thioredoxin domain
MTIAHSVHGTYVCRAEHVYTLVASCRALRSLRTQATVAVHPQARLSRPGGHRWRPRQRPGIAPVTIVVFSDFHCPFSKRVLPTLAQLETQCSDRAKLVFRDFPIDQLHPQACKAHEAAR